MPLDDWDDLDEDTSLVDWSEFVQRLSIETKEELAVEMERRAPGSPAIISDDEGDIAVLLDGQIMASAAFARKLRDHTPELGPQWETPRTPAFVRVSDEGDFVEISSSNMQSVLESIKAKQPQVPALPKGYELVIDPPIIGAAMVAVLQAGMTISLYVTEGYANLNNTVLRPREDGIYTLTMSDPSGKHRDFTVKAERGVSFRCEPADTYSDEPWLIAHEPDDPTAVLMFQEGVTWTDDGDPEQGTYDVLDIRFEKTT